MTNFVFVITGSFIFDDTFVVFVVVVFVVVVSLFCSVYPSNIF